MDVISLVITVAIVGLVLYKQFRGQFVGGNRDVVLPFVVMGIGLLTVAQAHPSVTTAGVALLAAELVVVGGLGVLRGYAFRIGTRDGWAYRSGSAALLAAWVLTIGVRIGSGFLGESVGAGLLLSTSSALVFGGSLLVQSLVVRRRVAASGLPVRPDRGRRVRAAA
ncbi:MULTISPECIES: hypothetical protein [Pseudonocardia]|uniref:DUF1453 domain-containing protein n=2 Tax=Pseudonocardia TaxID=1847 RepID=A0A1Y2MQV2_PSEAH|nr:MULTISPECIES: hypothetical protein [Pseudonocardia]OSY37603.1 hypothetical protein BG845_04640 [Pseudonocardia autotrophica]TDN73725.1 hypothetical protein C8E95_2829 [Pseudonocardia autotrophica]BBG04468.1 hypothetical protein Pdca_56770 [Pseudonocardia autotrophica]GEC27286.1 hypothetical protein PSA01_43150 [Pseudonocardia saturnea]